MRLTCTFRILSATVAAALVATVAGCSVQVPSDDAYSACAEYYNATTLRDSSPKAVADIRADKVATAAVRARKAAQADQDWRELADAMEEAHRSLNNPATFSGADSRVRAACKVFAT